MIHDILYYVSMIIGGMIVGWYLPHFHRWGKWKAYSDTVSSVHSTRQYRKCKDCDKIEDETVSYASSLLQEVEKDV